MESELHHIDRLIASRMKGYTQTPPDHVWREIENKLNKEDSQSPKSSASKELLKKFRITYS